MQARSWKMSSEVTRVARDEFAVGFSMSRKINGLIAVLILGLIAMPGYGQKNLHPLLKRIYDGDYVWSSDFPSREAALIGYGWGLYNAIQEKCPELISGSSKSQVDAAFAHMTNTNQYGQSVSAVALQAARLGGANLALRNTAAGNVEEVRLSEGCAGRTLSRSADNVWRMLATKRPAHQAEGINNSTLIKEIILPIDTYHFYPDVGVSIVGGAAWRVFKADVDQLGGYGMTILECHYDKNSADQHHEEQYYWGPSLGAQVFSPIPIFWQNFLDSSQGRMDKAMGMQAGGRYRAIHPFTTYGAPRGECPPIADRAMHVARFENPDLIRWPDGMCKRLDNGLLDCP
jgi:hypothetical protein